eukprot:CAMPEP_0168623168 /NCGR_PEP_ID=MMETSP0449_2-20121227/8677_1 /TAXON_ID=1082188 /ORGANISM="Strombidium rassoulzadegani, Strain ras09" /LENGTH=84 /DNA_ID=CAMNT_0008664523 /DNA_START=498 /DNA_END=752 /DNA_ORIENTATION=+
MFCYEEILAANPTNYQHNLKYAEIVYSSAVANQNSLTQLEIASKYFQHALVLVDDVAKTKVANNVVRALWGLLKCCKTIRNVHG